MKRSRPLAVILGGWLLFNPLSSKAAEQLMFEAGLMNRRLSVETLRDFAESGDAQGLLKFILRFGGQSPERIQGMLSRQQRLPLPIVGRLLYSRMGEEILGRVATYMYPRRAPAAGMLALRAGLILSLASKDGTVTAIDVLEHYPNREVSVPVPRVLKLMKQVQSIPDLIRFFVATPP